MGSVNVTPSKRSEYTFKPYAVRRLIPRNDADEIPMGRSGHRIVSDDFFVYSFGGFNPCLDDDDESNNSVREDFKLFKEIWRFSITRSKWEKLESFTRSLPRQLASNAVVMKGNLFVVHGGTGMPFGYANTNRTFVGDLRHGKTLRRLHTKGSHPFPRYGHAMVLGGHYLYVVGGTTGYEYTADVHCLNLKTMTWECLYVSEGLSNLEPQGRYRHELALYNSRIIIFGGGTDSHVFEFENLHAFNLYTKEWEILATSGDPRGNGPSNNLGFPAPRRCHGSVQVPGDDIKDPEVVICGGYDGVEKMFSDMWRLNLRTLQWTRCDYDMLQPLYFHSSSVSPNGQMFIFGGVCETSPGEETMRTNELQSAWVMIPKLKEICWDAILYYNPDLDRVDAVELIDSGVPLEFVQRLHS